MSSEFGYAIHGLPNVFKWNIHIFPFPKIMFLKCYGLNMSFSVCLTKIVKEKCLENTGRKKNNKKHPQNKQTKLM